MKAVRAYRPMLRLPGALAFCAAALIGRMPLSMLGIGSVLLVQDRRGSYALGGLVAAAYAVGQALGAPAVSRAIDRRGQGAVLLPSLAVSVTAVAGVVLTAGLNVRGAVVVLFAAIAGAAQPPLGACVRARWAALLRTRGRVDLLDTALALESVLDEVVFVAGPAGVVALAVAFDPGVALLAAAGLMSAGTVWFALQRASEPPAGAGAEHVGTTVLRTAGLRTVVLVMVAVGALFGALEIAMVAFADEQGRRAAAGVLLPLVALASGVAGLLYGARRWRRPLELRLRWALVGLTAGTVPLLLAPGLLGMAVAALVAGLAISPTLIASFGLVERLVPTSAHTEGFTWLNTGINVGAAAGAALAGALADGPGARAAFGVCVGGALLAVAVGVAGGRTLSEPTVDGGDFPHGGDAETVTRSASATHG